jgi:hypothetical protein
MINKFLIFSNVFIGIYLAYVSRLKNYCYAIQIRALDREYALNEGGSYFLRC